MKTYQDNVGTWASIDVRAPDHDGAVSRARQAVRREGLRVMDVAHATRQPESHRWVVDIRLGRVED